jgi:hypothetical protein
MHPPMPAANPRAADGGGVPHGRAPVRPVYPANLLGLPSACVPAALDVATDFRSVFS